MPHYITLAVIEAAGRQEITERDLDREWALRTREVLNRTRRRKRAARIVCIVIATLIALAIVTPMIGGMI